MKKRTSSMSRRIVSLLMSMVLTLTLVTPAAFATEVVGGSGTAIIEGNTNPADPAPGEDSENNEDKNTEDGKDEQPTEPGDEGKNPDEDNGDDASKPDGDSKDKENPDGDKKDEENKNEQPTEDENNGDDEIALLNAENAADAWNGTTDTSWYENNKDATEFSIGTAAELAGLAKLVNDGTNFSGKTIKLTADIRLNNDAVPTSGNQWTPIGKYVSSREKKPFSGTFDGQGHTISGLYINLSNRSGNLYQGLFGYCSGGIVQNLIVTGSVAVKGSTRVSIQYVAGIVGYGANSSAVKNCGFYGTINVENGSGSCTNKNGGVLGHTPSKVNATVNCWFYSVDAESKLDVGAKSANCVKLTATEKMDAKKLDTLNTKIPETGKKLYLSAIFDLYDRFPVAYVVKLSQSSSCSQTIKPLLPSR